MVASSVLCRHVFDHITFDLHVFQIHELHAVLRG
jgi:predicted SAM-dependent methyltransferase